MGALRLCSLGVPGSTVTHADAMTDGGNDRWTRGAGSGIGLSEHKTAYRGGGSVGNWVEDRTIQTHQPRVLPLCDGSPMSMSTTYRKYLGGDVPPPKTAVELLAPPKMELWKMRPSSEDSPYATTYGNAFKRWL